MTGTAKAPTCADIVRIDRESEDRDAAEFVAAAESLTRAARGSTVEIHVHDDRIARGLARVDGATVKHFPIGVPDADAWEFWAVKCEGVTAFSRVEVSK